MSSEPVPGRAGLDGSDSSDSSEAGVQSGVQPASRGSDARSGTWEPLPAIEGPPAPRRGALSPLARAWLGRAAVWAPLGLGLAWLVQGAAGSLPMLLVAGIPGSVLLAAGVSVLLWPGDARPFAFAAGASLLGVPLGLLAIAGLGLAPGGALLAASVAVFLVQGWATLDRLGTIPGVPSARWTPWLAARASLDEALMAALHLRFRFPEGASTYARLGRDVDTLLALDAENGWEADPASYHRIPPPPDVVQLTREQAFRVVYERLEFDSGFELHPGEPARAGWVPPASETAPNPNARVHAWVLRHADPTRPWLIAINGYRMGQPHRDFLVFPPRLYHRQLGLNVAIYALPLHGPRTLGRLSGDGFLDGDPLQMRYAEAQAMWDLRRLLAWIRSQGALRIGVAGVSLGGYTAALLASLEPLDFVIAGTPLVDLVRTCQQHGPPSVLRSLESEGLTPERVERLMRPVSPLHVASRVPRAARFLYGGVADGVVSPDQFRDLYEHWERPRQVWYAGGHIARPGEIWPDTKGVLRDAKILA